MRWLSRVALLLGAAALVLLSAELLLQLAAARAKDRSGTAASGVIPILCVGDSHTFGSVVSQAEAYPGQLQRELDRVEPGRFRVINRGVPGFTSTMVRRRLDRLAALHEARMVIVWVGVNDGWNAAEAELLATQAPTDRVERSGWLERSRLLQLIRARSYGERADRYAREFAAEKRPKIQLPRPAEQGGGIHIELDGEEEDIEVVAVADAERAENLRLSIENFVWLLRWGEAHSIPVLLISYPHMHPFSLAANGAIRAAAEQFDGTRILNGYKALESLPDEERHKMVWGAHPTAPQYREIAKAAALRVREAF